MDQSSLTLNSRYKRCALDSTVFLCVKMATVARIIYDFFSTNPEKISEELSFQPIQGITVFHLVQFHVPLRLCLLQKKYIIFF